MNAPLLETFRRIRLISPPEQVYLASRFHKDAGFRTQRRLQAKAEPQTQIQGMAVNLWVSFGIGFRSFQQHPVSPLPNLDLYAGERI